MTKVGTEFFEVFIDEATGECRMETWEVRTIRGGRITAIHRDRFTWVKLSKKNGDFGWAKTIDPLWRATWDVQHPRPGYLALNKRAAWRKLLNDGLSGRLYIDDETILAKIIKTAKRHL